MANARIETPTGAVNGVNTSFSVSQAYTPGTAILIWRGRPRATANDDGIIETNPATGAFTAKQAPKTGDVVQLFYIDTSTSIDTILNAPIAGSVETADEMGGAATTKDALSGQIEDQ